MASGPSRLVPRTMALHPFKNRLTPSSATTTTSTNTNGYPFEHDEPGAQTKAQMD